MLDPEEIVAESSVEEVTTAYPTTVFVFAHRRMFCASCEVARFETVASACRIYGQPLEAVLAELRECARGGHPERRALDPGPGSHPRSLGCPERPPGG